MAFCIAFGIAGKTWALKRIQHACKLNLTVSAQSDDQHDALSDGARAMKQASEGLTRLNALVLSSSSGARPGYLPMSSSSHCKMVFGGRAVTCLE